MFAKKIIYFLIVLFTVQAARAQRPAVDTGKPEGKRLEIINAERLNMQSIDSLHNKTF